MKQLFIKYMGILYWTAIALLAVAVIAGAISYTGVFTGETALKRPKKESGGGHAYISRIRPKYLSLFIPSDSGSSLEKSRLELFEDGKPLGPAHGLHPRIREKGMGAYSHWCKHVIFSSSDNSDPSKNGRIYTIRYFLIMPPVVFVIILFVIMSLLICRNSYMAGKTRILFEFMRTKGIDFVLRPYVSISILVLMTFFFHTVDIFSHALYMQPDSESYLMGAESLIKEFSLKEVSPCRGPGLAIMIAPFMKIFGQNSAWPVKIFLHLMGAGCVIMGYMSAFQIIRNRVFALLCGGVLVFSKTLVCYSNQLLSEIPSAFLIMLSTYFALKYLREFRFSFLYLAAAVLSFSVLLRPENLLVYLLFFIIAAGSVLYLFGRIHYRRRILRSQFYNLIFAAVLSSVPILGWCTFNYVYRNFWGLTDYSAMAIYDGWLDFARANKFYIPVKECKSLSIIDEAIRKHRQISLDRKEEWDEGRCVGYNAGYDEASLLATDYDIKTANSIFIEGTKEFIVYYIRNKPMEFADIIRLKLINAVTTYYAIPTCPDIGEEGYGQEFSFPGPNHPTRLKNYFYFWNLENPEMIKLQRAINKVLFGFYYGRYGVLLYCLNFFALFGIVFLLFMKPHRIWFLLASFTAAKVLFPAIISWSQLRLTIPGIPLYLILTVAFYWLLSNRIYILCLYLKTRIFKYWNISHENSVDSTT